MQLLVGSYPNHEVDLPIAFKGVDQLSARLTKQDYIILLLIQAELQKVVPTRAFFDAFDFTIFICCPAATFMLETIIHKVKLLLPEDQEGHALVELHQANVIGLVFDDLTESSNN